ncbi:MAG: beta-lactamase family protein, partial [Firmicutes bacterium]|nr:beta-lactamase family protein [Bacillota bacterium]
LSLHDKLTDILPDFEMADERFRDIELLHMLTHTSGIGDCEEYHWDKPRCDEAALADYVYSDEVTKQPMVWAPGTGFRYSNVAYEILGHITSTYSDRLPAQDGQRQAGRVLCYEDLVQRYCFKPAGMTDSTMKTFERPEGSLVTPHEKRPDRSIGRVEHFPYTRQHAPSSTFTSNVSDLLKWGRAHLGGASKRPMKAAEGSAGAADNSRGIFKDPGIYETIWKPYAEVPNNGERIGIGWFIRKQRGYTLYGHEGSDDGFRASFWICPELDTVTVVLSNLSDAPVKKINKKLFERIVSI